MRLALYHNLPPGGAFRAVHEYTRRLATSHRIELYRLDEHDGGSDGETLLDRTVHAVHGYRLQGLADVGASGGSVRFPGYLRRLAAAQAHVAKDIDAGGFDAVLVHPCRITQTPAVLSMVRTPSVYYMQEPRRASFEDAFRARPSFSGAFSLARWGWRQLIERRVRRIDERAARAAGLVLANSYYSIESIYRAYGRDAIFCPLGVDGELFSLSQTADRENRLLSVGALVPHKGHDFVIQSAAAVDERRRPSVGIVCNGLLASWAAHLERLALESGVRLELHHGVSDARLAELYQTSLATFCAARLEPFGLSVLESMCCGTPVIAVREGGFREVVTHGVNGILVNRDPREGGAAIELLLDGGGVSEKTSLRATVLPAWSWDRAAAKLESLICTFIT